VLRLVAQGMTAAQVAEQLDLSPHSLQDSYARSTRRST